MRRICGEEHGEMMFQLLKKYRMICCTNCLLPIIATTKGDATTQDYQYYACDEDEIDIIVVTENGDLKCPNCNQTFGCQVTLKK